MSAWILPRFDKLAVSEEGIMLKSYSLHFRLFLYRFSALCAVRSILSAYFFAELDQY